LNPRYAIFLSLFLICQSSFAQIEVVPIYREPLAEKENKNARTGSIPAKSLPFWDDFSGRISMGFYPDDQVWENSRSVWVNSGMGINPPSLNVATFDGYDSVGKPYSVNDILAKGFADKITSGPLKLGDVASPDRASVFISFFYQFKGNGEPPDPGDLLTLLFKNNVGQWKSIWSIQNNGTLSSDQFVQVILPVVNSEYFHNDFQFRFQNFGRLSGPFDTWNIDYVYLNRGRSSVDTSFPDRAITSALTSLFDPYWAIPIKHYLKSPSALSPPSFNVYNLRAGNDQPLNHFSFAQITNFKGVVRLDSTDTRLDSAQSDGSLLGLQRKKFSLVKLPPLSQLNNDADSAIIKIGLRLSTKDNQTIANNGDYDPIKYSPIKFTSNDTLSSSHTLSKYYAYDDGTAEYGAKISQTGTQLAYQYDLKASNTNDGLIAIDLYFPRFGDESNQTIQLIVMGTLTGNESDYLFRQNVTVQRNNQNKFWRFEIPGGVSVPTPFYIGWKLNSPAVIAIGLDRNTDSGSKMFFNATGAWEQNTTLQGSLMLRPVFGEATDPINDVVTEISKPYPNPTQGTIYLPQSAQQIQLFDLYGKVVEFEGHEKIDAKEIKITNPSFGLYLVRYFDQIWHTEKIMVRP